MSDVYGSGGEGIEPEIVWCPACVIHLPEGPNTLRVRGDGIRRHIDCDTPVRTEEQHARDMAAEEKALAIAEPVGAPHVVKRGMTISTCSCAMTHDHDAFGREIVVGPFDGNGFQVMDKAVADRLTEVRHDLEKQINATMGIPPALAGPMVRGVDAHRLFAPDPEVQLIVDSLEEEQAKYPARLRMRQALIGDILAGTTVWEKPPLYSDAEKLAENLLDSGWIPSTDRMAR